MGIQVEFNPDLALRDISEYKSGNRKIEECIPEPLEEGKVYDFLKKGQRLYYLSDSEFWGNGQIPLMQTSGNENLSRPIASVKILEATHFLDEGECYTKGKYKVISVFDEKDPKIHFEACKIIEN
ncbi:MAG TPA: hypothetical protein DIT25_03965 [Candidatus Moranbacteria bacterium]|nr:hypothetical protein [Candidatus Moranbacteria bacterium]